MAALVGYPSGDLREMGKTGEAIVTLGVNEYDNGELGSWDRKGKGRTLKPGP